MSVHVEPKITYGIITKWRPISLQHQFLEIITTAYECNPQEKSHEKKYVAIFIEESGSIAFAFRGLNILRADAFLQPFINFLVNFQLFTKNMPKNDSNSNVSNGNFNAATRLIFLQLDVLFSQKIDCKKVKDGEN